MCPQLPRLSLEYSHKAGLQTVITGMPLQIRPVTDGGHAGPVTMGRIARGPLSWTRPHCGMTSSPVFVRCRSSEGCPCLFCLCLTSGYQRRLRARGGVFAFAPTTVRDQDPLPTNSEAAVRGDRNAAEVATLLRVSSDNCGVILPPGGDHPVPRGLG
jgi:hypothetical protein